MRGLRLGLGALRSTLSGKLGGPTLPAGALGVWYMDQYVTSPRQIIPNEVTKATKPVAATSLGPPPWRMFGTSTFWNGSSGLTATDLAAVDPNGLSEASSIAPTADNWYLSADVTGLPAASSGSYTMAGWFKRNTTTDQAFKMKVFSKGTVATFTATATWQRFSMTFTQATAITDTLMWATTVDGLTASRAQLLVYGLQIFDATSDPYPTLGSDPGPAGHITMMRGSYDTSVTYAGGALTFPDNKYGIMQLPTQSISAMTIIAIAKVNTAAGDNAVGPIAKFQSYTAASALFNNGGADAYFGGSSFQASTVKNQSAKLWTFNGKSWAGFGARYDGANGDYWLDDILIIRKVIGVLSAQSVADWGIAAINGTGIAGGVSIAAMAIYPRALTDAEYRTAYAALVSRVAANSITPTVERIIVFEGDSITATTAGSGAPQTAWPAVYSNTASPVFHGLNNSVSGSQVLDMTNRAASIDLIPRQGGRKFILPVLIGHNDLIAVTDATFLANFAAYCDARRAAGWKVVVCTIPPSTVGGTFNARRAASNTELKLWTTGGSVVSGIHADAIIDFAADATMGPDAAASNTALYADGTHPTATGEANLAAIAATVLNAL